ncbi:NAD(P)-dependent oxidoreductase [Flavobacterium aurantiibacter]|uniref:Hydroxyacid dehydrogenase n=1 Tax=Flavobacterium aurantiibacter TaxID=2023067 RepID=A0A255ZS58_9FLAO|nr:2-hydroxyacid dehydrogenase [Flavobacterium aurantiibacter]OYQ44261.1 hypothetical protein CHX27_08110 [Flavobacterium aurantiibacter]
MNGKLTLAITESNNFNPAVVEKLKDFFSVRLFDIKSEADLLLALENADIAFIRLRFHFRSDILKQLPKLKYIVTATTGLDHIDTNYFNSIGGVVVSLRGETAFLSSIPSTAEFTWGLLLSIYKNTIKASTDVNAGNWQRDQFRGRNLKNKRIGILGLGRVGKQVANYARTFSMEVGFYDPVEVSTDFLKMPTAEELFSWADIISIHIDYSSRNHNFVDASLLRYCKETAVLINTSRGAVWDEEYLAELIRNKKVFGVATDVIVDEFIEKSVHQNPLVKLANEGYNVIVTPHIAGATIESMAETEFFVMKKLLKILNYECAE